MIGLSAERDLAGALQAKTPHPLQGIFIHYTFQGIYCLYTLCGIRRRYTLYGIMWSAFVNQMIRSPGQLGNLIQQARLQRGMTQKDLADRIGTYQKTVSGIENGNSGARLDTMFSLLAALDMDLQLVPRRKSGPDIEEVF